MHADEIGVDQYLSGTCGLSISGYASFHLVQNRRSRYPAKLLNSLERNGATPFYLRQSAVEFLVFRPLFVSIRGSSVFVPGVILPGRPGSLSGRDGSRLADLPRWLSHNLIRKSFCRCPSRPAYRAQPATPRYRISPE